MSRKEKIKGDTNMVECGVCKRWCYLEETDFDSVAEAEKSTFVCRLCEKIEEGLKRLEREWKVKFEEMKEELKEEREKRVLLETQVTELKRGEPEVKWQAELKRALQSKLSLYLFCGFHVSWGSGKPAGTERVTKYQCVIF